VELELSVIPFAHHGPLIGCFYINQNRDVNEARSVRGRGHKVEAKAEAEAEARVD